MAVDFGLGPILLATVSVENAAAAADLYAASFLQMSRLPAGPRRA